MTFSRQLEKKMSSNVKVDKNNFLTVDTDTWLYLVIYLYENWWLSCMLVNMNCVHKINWKLVQGSANIIHWCIFL